MKILRLTAENVKKLRAVEITPKGELVEICGKNGAGKTSVLDSIWWALAGTKHIQAVPIRKGATKARIRLDLGELTVERRFTEKGSTLTVENAEGARFTSPQGILDALLGALTFDPLAFVGQEPREQFETLRKLVPLEIDVDQLDGLNRRDFDQRTEINRQAKALRAQADGVTVPETLPAAAIDTAVLKDRMTHASKENGEIETRRIRREQAAKDADDLRRRAAEKQKDGAAVDIEIGEIQASARARIEAIAKAAEAQADRLHAKIVDLARESAELIAQAALLDTRLAQAEPFLESVDVETIRAQIDAAEVINRGIEQRSRKAQLVTDAAQLEAQAQGLTETMEARAKAKADAIASAAMPVAGLGFGDGAVTFDGLPFDQASTAEQLRVSVALAMAANPKLRVIRIKEGSLLDQDNVALIAGMARERDYQVWLETVRSGGRPAVVIEDGQVVAVNGEPMPETAEAQP